MWLGATEAHSEYLCKLSLQSPWQPAAFLRRASSDLLPSKWAVSMETRQLPLMIALTKWHPGTPLDSFACMCGCVSATAGVWYKNSKIKKARKRKWKMFKPHQSLPAAAVYLRQALCDSDTNSAPPHDSHASCRFMCHGGVLCTSLGGQEKRYPCTTICCTFHALLQTDAATNPSPHLGFALTIICRFVDLLLKMWEL